MNRALLRRNIARAKDVERPDGVAPQALELTTTGLSVGISSNMAAALLLKERHVLAPNRFVEIRIWRVTAPVRGSAHTLKYALVHVVEGVCVLRYDNEAGKGDHRHVGEIETRYSFTTPEQLLADFWHEVEGYKPR